MSEHRPAAATATASPLPFTGERFTPECVREIWYEHWHRYAFALPLARGRRVLDAACGEGYGSALLAGVAASVLGIDIDAEAVSHARARYGSEGGPRFEHADVAVLDALPEAGFDLIVCFETLEHLREHERLLDGFARLLAPGGRLLISTPDKTRYNAHGGPANPHHVRELEREEFEALLAARFPHRRLYGQKLLFQSALWALDEGGEGWHASTERDGTIVSGLDYPPLYYLAVCAREAVTLAGLPALDLFGDRTEQVYRHYDEEVRRHIAAGRRLAELEAETATLREALRAAAPEGIGVVVVSHHSASTLAECLGRLLSAEEVAAVVVVDNGSGDDSPAIARRLAETEPRLRVLVDSENPGFAAACNRGAAMLSTRWLAFVNPDLMVEADSLRRLCSALADDPGIGLIGADLVDADGVPDGAARRREPRLASVLSAGGSRAGLALPVDPEHEPQTVDAVSGALMLMPAALFRGLGGFDPGYRLHAEDLDLCRRVRDAGHRVAVANRVRVLHLRGVSSRRRPVWVEWQKHRGMWRYFRRHEGREHGAVVRLLVALAVVGRFLPAAARAWWRAKAVRVNGRRR